MRSVPAPSMSAPIATRHRARSTISGSRAALTSTLSPLAKRRGHHHILGGADRDDREHDLGAREPMLGARLDIAAVELDRRAQALQSLDVEIDRPRADGAAARQRHARLPIPRDERPQHQHRGAHLAHEIVGRRGRDDAPRVERQHLARLVLALGAAHGDGDAVLDQEMRHRGDVGDARHAAAGSAARRSEGTPPSAAGPHSWRRRSGFGL